MSFLLKKNHIFYIACGNWILNTATAKRNVCAYQFGGSHGVLWNLAPNIWGAKTIGTAYSFTFNNFVMILTCHVASKIMIFPQNQVVLGSSWGSWPRCLPLHKANGCLVTPGGCQQRSTACWWPLRFCTLFLWKLSRLISLTLFPPYCP